MSNGIFAEPGAPNPEHVVDSNLSEITANALSSMDEPAPVAEPEPTPEPAPEPEAEPTPDLTPDEEIKVASEELKLDPETEYLMPDGTKMTGRQILDGNLRQSDYTRNKQALALEREELAELNARLKEREESQSADTVLMRKINALRSKSADAREELAALIEAHGDSATASEIKADPEIAELKSKIASLEAAREEAVRSASANETKARVDRVFSDLAKKYQYADQSEAEALVISGKFERFEDAVRYSHSRVEAILQKKTTEKITAAAKVKETKQVVPTKAVASSVAPEGLNPLLMGSVFDSSSNAARNEYIANMKELNI